jgi:TonB-dependent receptor
VDVDYEGLQKIRAWYWMVDLPVSSFLNVIGGVRYETTELAITVDPEQFATWIPFGADGPFSFDIEPGAGNTAFEQKDLLPSVGFQLKPTDKLTVRGSYTETVARQTFRELSPVQQVEYLGGEVFVGNPELTMSALKNYDVRVDYTPSQGSLISASYFYKDIESPIEYVQRVAQFAFTTPVNYPKGKLSGIEVEVRQQLGQFWHALDGLTVGANATFIESEVTLTPEEIEAFNEPNLQVPMTTRDMTNAPEFLYNLYLTYDLERTGTQFGIFYTVRGDTLVAGAGQSKGNFIPSVYDTEYGTLNLSVSQRLGEHWKLKLAAKNLTNPKIQQVYRSDYLDEDTVKTSYRKGIELSLGISAEWRW